METYMHVPTRRTCYIMNFFEHDYLVFTDNQQTVTLSKEGLYSKHTLSKIVNQYDEVFLK